MNNLHSENSHILTDNIRYTEPWSVNIEKYMQNIADICGHQAMLHNEAGYIFQNKNTIWGLPPVIIPLIMAPLSALLDSDEIYTKYINTTAFTLSAVFSGIYSFFKFNKQTEQHFNHSAKYTDLRTDIEADLIRDRRFRESAEVLIQKYQTKLDTLSNTAPVIPQNIVKLYEPKKPEKLPHPKTQILSI